MSALVCAVSGSPVVAGGRVAAVPSIAPHPAARVPLARLEVPLAASRFLPHPLRPPPGAYYHRERLAAHCHLLGL